MLKIKDNVALKELEKFGFKARYNKNTSEIEAYEKNAEDDDIELNITIYKNGIIRIFKTIEMKNGGFPFIHYFDIDTLYDLIQANLVEKV